MTANDIQRNSTYDHDDKASYDGRFAGIIMCIISVIMAIVLIPAMGAIVDSHANADTAITGSEKETVTVNVQAEEVLVSESAANTAVFEKLLSRVGIAQFVDRYGNFVLDDAEPGLQDNVTFEMDK